MPSGQIKAEVRIVGGLNNNKDTSGGVTKRVRRNISYRKVREVGGPFQAEGGMAFKCIVLKD
jgi:hypothetical protein